MTPPNQAMNVADAIAGRRSVRRFLADRFRQKADPAVMLLDERRNIGDVV